MTNDKDALRVRLINIICGDVLPTYNHVTKADMVITAVEEPLRARIAELEDGLSSACEYAEKYEAALKRLYDAALDIDVNEMSSTERDWWQTELRAARAAYLGEKE